MAARQPIRCSALYRRHLALGARITEEHGWRVASQFSSPETEARQVREGVGLADDSWLGKLDVRGDDLESVDSGLGPERGRIWRLARGHALITCEPQHTAAVLEEAQRAIGQRAAGPRATAGTTPRPPCIHVTDVTSAYTALLLAGPKSRHVLEKLTALNVSERALPSGSCAQAALAHVHALVLREDLGAVLAYRLLVDRAYGEYAWDAVLDAGHEFAVAPFGLQARRLLERG